MSHRLPTSWEDPEPSRGGDAFAAFRPAFGGGGREFGGPVGRASRGDGPNVVYAQPTALRVGRSSSGRVVARDELPAWDDVLRAVDTPSISSCSSSEDERHPSPGCSKGAAAAASSATAYTTAAAGFTSLPPSNPGLGSAGSYYKFPTSADTTGGAEDDDVWGLIPDEADAPTLGRHSSSCWALHPVHAGITVVSNYGDKADDSGAGAQPDHSCISAAPVVEVDNPRAEEHDLAFGWREEVRAGTRQ